MNDLQRHDWKKVRAALHDLQADTAINKPDSFSLLNALITVLASLPDDE